MPLSVLFHSRRAQVNLRSLTLRFINAICRYKLIASTCICFFKGKFPQITKSPVVSVDVTKNRLRFKCKIDPEERDDNVRYEVKWFQGVPQSQIKKDKLSVAFPESHLQNGIRKDKQLFYLGQEVSFSEERYSLIFGN